MVAEGGVDAETLGRATWTFLHTLAATYPPNPTRAEQERTARFMRDFSQIYPCAPCAESFRAIIKRVPVDARSGPSFARWMCVVHNEVNKELGKEVFNCSSVGERWGVCESCAAHHGELEDFKKSFKGFVTLNREKES